VEIVFREGVVIGLWHLMKISRAGPIRPAILSRLPLFSDAVLPC
jgi:hypothetical protein